MAAKAPGWRRGSSPEAAKRCATMRRALRAATGPVKMNVRELSQKYEVSRSHVHKLLQDAGKAGLLTRSPDAQTGVLSETLRQGIIQLHVTQLIGTAACAQAAMVATARGAAAAPEPASRMAIRGDRGIPF